MVRSTGTAAPGNTDLNRGWRLRFNPSVWGAWHAAAVIADQRAWVTARWDLQGLDANEQSGTTFQPRATRSQ